MYMVGHQHVGVDVDLVTCGAGKDRLKVQRIIGRMKETRLAIVAALHDMHRHTG